jgi:hypothetical protein
MRNEILGVTISAINETLPFLSLEIATPPFGRLAMTERVEIATPAFGGLAMTSR